MFLGIVLLVVVIATAIISRMADSYDISLLSGMVSVLTGIYLLCHVFALSLISYNYESFVNRRNAFVETLENSRENGNDYETATIVKDISHWNERLAEQKFDNTTLYFDQYIDDRWENIKPIK